MTYLEGACGTHYCNDVETYGGINTEMLHVGIGGYDGPAYFLPVDGVLGLDVLRIAPGLYFYDDHFVVFSGNDVQFQMVFPPVPVSHIRCVPDRLLPHLLLLCPAHCVLPLYDFLSFSTKIRFFCFVFTEVKLNLQRNMRKRDKTCAKATPEEPKREQRMVCLMSEEELRIVDRYLEKYKITNKSRWLRETILMFIHKNMEEDYPTLFGEHDMRR